MGPIIRTQLTNGIVEGRGISQSKQEWGLPLEARDFTSQTPKDGVTWKPIYVIQENGYFDTLDGNIPSEADRRLKVRPVMNSCISIWRNHKKKAPFKIK